MYDIQQIRKDFPILSRTVYGKPLVYLDNSATTQKPRAVVDAIANEYYSENANVHRGVHFLSQQATELHEAARAKVAGFLNASSPAEIVFTRGATEGLNLVASSFGEAFLKEGDEVIVSAMEHHSNIVPWQLLEMRRGIKVKVIPITEDGELRMDEYERMFNARTKAVSVTHVSNVLGTVNPVKEITAIAHAQNVPVLIDGAQSVPHTKVDVQDIGCDFYAFSGHKVYGPTGIGALYGKAEWLEKLPPYQGGGEMIKNVHFGHTEFEDAPLKFEAGTPDYVGSHSLATAIDYVEKLGIGNIAAHEHELLEYATGCLDTIPGMRIFGRAQRKSAVLSFVVGNIHPLDLGTLLDRLGIAIRTGHHCAQPLVESLGVQSVARASFGLYNTKEEVDALADGIERVMKMF